MWSLLDDPLEHIAILAVGIADPKRPPRTRQQNTTTGLRSPHRVLALGAGPKDTLADDTTVHGRESHSEAAAGGEGAFDRALRVLHKRLVQQANVQFKHRPHRRIDNPAATMLSAVSRFMKSSEPICLPRR